MDSAFDSITSPSALTVACVTNQWRTWPNRVSCRTVRSWVQSQFIRRHELCLGVRNLYWINHEERKDVRWLHVLELIFRQQSYMTEEDLSKQAYWRLDKHRWLRLRSIAVDHLSRSLKRSIGPLDYQVVWYLGTGCENIADDVFCLQGTSHVTHGGQ